MATDLGTTIRRARERKRMSQQDVASALGVSRSAVNAWENGRAEPRNSLGALEELLDVNLSDGPGVNNHVDPDELVIWRLAHFTDDEKRTLIAALRRERAR